MANREVGGTQEKKEYQFNKLPENIRQMGEQPEKNRVYIEDYVVTYMHQVFQKEHEEAIVIFVGQKGEGRAGDSSFIYGAIDVKLDLLAGNRAFTKETWEEIYGKVCESFPGAQVLGWGCGVSMWNSQIDRNVQQIQQKHFSQEEKILFMEDLSEKEEKIFHWHNGKLEEMSGYVIYYDKNPQMQEYMLKGQPQKSFEADYHDDVTPTVREVIQRKEEKEETKRFATYTVGAAVVLLAIFGANLLLQSTKKIDSLEKTLETLSNATVSATASPSQEEGRVRSTALPSSSVLDPVPKATAVETIPPVESSKNVADKGEEEKIVKNNANQKSNVQSAGKKMATPTTKPKKKQQSVANSKKAKSNQSSQQTSSLGNGNQSYLVRSGDTLSQIVWRQYHSMKYMDMVKKANNIADEDAIKVGQRLILPQYTK